MTKTTTQYILFFRIFVISLLLITFASVQEVMAQRTNYKAYALYLYNFMKYTEWPQGNSQTIKIAVIGKSKLYEELSKMSETRTVMGKKIEASEMENPTNLTNYHMVFVTGGKSSILKDILNQTSGKPILVVTEREGLTRKGACISFVVFENEDLGFEVNMSALLNHKLKIANRLLELGIVLK